MMLFFETSKQGWCFLSAVPVGFLIACCLCTGKKEGSLRLVADLLLLAFSGIALVGMVLFFHDASFRMYHLLGILSGAILYLCGINHVQMKLSCLVSKRKQRKKKCGEGIVEAETEIINHA